jgi:hypothetical protein
MITAPTPYAGLYEAALYNAITILAPCLRHLQDENGQAFSIPVRADFSTDDAEFSEVVISIEPGQVGFGPGLNMGKWDAGNGQIVKAARAMNCSIWMRIKAQNHALRKYIIDALSAAILADFILAPDGSLAEGAILDSFIAVGIEPGSLSKPNLPPPNLSDDRPEGQVYEAEMALVCNIWLTWNESALSLWNGTIGITNEVTSLPGLLPAFDTVLDTVPV